MLEHDPDTLLNLAVDAFGDYLTSVVQKWQTSPWMPWFAGNVHAALGNVMLPSHLANEVTARLLRQLDLCTDWKRSPLFLDHPYFENTYGSAMSHLTSALVHPAVTHLNLSCTETYYKHKAVDKLLSQSVCELGMLKVLQLQRFPLYFEQLSLPNLQELTLSGACNDRLLELMLVTCGNIRKLDVSHSFEVTDSGVQFLAKFSLLEKVNVRRTAITKVGLTQLLTDLSKNKDSEGVTVMKSFGCSYLTSEQLQLLVDNFEHLVNLEMELISDDIDFSLLRNLKQLQSCTLIGGGKLEEILEVVGHQLKQLRCSITIGPIVDPWYIFKYCPSLICLSLDIRCHSHSSVFTPRTSFKSLQVVDLTVTQPYSGGGQCTGFPSCVLSHCTNVRVLKVKCYNANSNAVATAMLQNNPLEHLEELHWWSVGGEPLLPEVGRQIVRHCKNLKAMYGNVWWSRRRSRKLWYGHNGVDMNSWVFVADPCLI